MIEWEIHGMEVGNCNCAYGCPCQFNALPTHGHCRAIAFARIDEGYFGGAKLDGLKWRLRQSGLARSTRAKALFNRSLMSAQMQSSGKRFIAS